MSDVTQPSLDTLVTEILTQLKEILTAEETTGHEGDDAVELIVVGMHSAFSLGYLVAEREKLS